MLCIGERRILSWASLKTIVRVAVREPQPLVRWVRSRTVAKVDSIGLVVRKRYCQMLCIGDVGASLVEMI
jgi:hypothetical protein